MAFSTQTTQFEMLQLLINLPVLLIAIPMHELAHAWAATRLGDNTPDRYGRLTFNPLAHLDIFGSIALLLFGFGWGRSVPVNQSNFRRPKRDLALAALAGPAANILLALLFILLSKPVLAYLPAMRGGYGQGGAVLHVALETLIMTNLYLAVFNLLPVGPLDGANIFAAFLPVKMLRFMDRYGYQFGLLLLLLMMLGVLQLPIMLAANGIRTVLELLVSPLNALFR